MEAIAWQAIAWRGFARGLADFAFRPAAAAKCFDSLSFPAMPRATIIISADATEEREAADGWFDAWSSRMTFLSDNTGCGCCVDIYDVEGPQEAIDAIPASLSARSDWTHPNGPARAPRAPQCKLP